MNIPPKYEDVVFQLNELNKREAALREELAGANRRLGVCINQIEEQQHRLTVAEQRYDILRSAARRYLDFRHVGDCGQGYQFSGVHPQTELKNAINGVLKLAKEGAGS